MKKQQELIQGPNIYIYICMCRKTYNKNPSGKND